MPAAHAQVRYNLLNAGDFGPWSASFFGVVAPWLVTMFCYQGSLLVSFCNWSALLTISAVNLVVPLAVYRAALLRYPTVGETESSRLKEPFAAAAAAVPSMEGATALTQPFATAPAVIIGDGDPLFEVQATVVAVPKWLAQRVGGEVKFAEGLMAVVTAASVFIILFNLYSLGANKSVGSDGSPDPGGL